MKLFKNLKIYLTLFIILIIALILVSNKYVIPGLIIAGIGGVFYFLWDLVVKSKDQKIEELASMQDKTNQQIARLLEENNELRSRRLNVAEIKNLLDLGLLQVNTHFTRTWDEPFERGNRSFQFIGALQVRIIARYGIDLKEMRINYSKEKNEIQIANVEPRFLSFNDFDYTWKIAEVLEYKKPWLGSQHWRKSEEMEGVAAQIKEDLRVKTYQEVKQGPEELGWVLEPLKQQINNTIQLIFGSPYRTVRIVENSDETFSKLEEFSFAAEEKKEKPELQA